MQHWIVLTLLASLIALAARAETATASDDDGLLCIAAWHREGPDERGLPQAIGEPPMSFTPAPQWDSVYSFRVDKRVTVTSANGEQAVVRNLPLDRKVQVAVKLDGKPAETFSLDFGKAPKHRICLWLYEGYWHWVDIGWDEARGCGCERKGTGD